jgi:dipeptidyl aminopeptidase/acylaminoacyl peptidase
VPRNARWFLRWDSDGERVFFHRDEEGDERNDVYAIDREGAVEVVAEIDGQISIDDVSPDGDTLLLGSTRNGQMNCYRHDLASGETTKITDYERAVGAPMVSPDGDRIAYETNETEDFENRDVYAAAVDGSDPRNLEIGDVGAEATPIDWGPEGDRLLVADNTEDRTRCGVYDFESESIRWLGDRTHEEAPEAFTEDGTRVLGARTRDAGTVPIVYDLESGKAREFDLSGGVASFGMAGESLLGNDRVLLAHTTSTRRPDLLAYDPATDEVEILLESEYGGFSPAEFADSEYFTFESDGVPETPAEAVVHDRYETMEIGALLYDSGARPSPLIINPHGGPRSRDSDSFSYRTQFLLQRGFSVLQVNYRGSTGRGRSFVEAIYDDWGGAEQGDIATGVEHALDAHEWLDDDRVVVYGGYSAY